MAGKIVGALEKATEKMNGALKYLCVALLFVMMLLGTADVTGRYVFNEPVSGTYETFGMLLPAIVLMGLAYTQAARAHIRIELVLQRLPTRVQSALGIFTTIIALLITVVIFWHGLALSIQFFNQGKVINTILVPLYIPQLVVPLGALALFFVLFVQMLQYIIAPGEKR